MTLSTIVSAPLRTLRPFTSSRFIRAPSSNDRIYDEEYRADKRGDHADGQFEGVEQDARREIRQHEKHRPAEERRGKQPLVIRADDHAHHMRGHEADKADGAADGDADADQRGDRDQKDKFDPPHRYADVARVVLADGKGVELRA